jgi:hypothetical protein
MRAMRKAVWITGLLLCLFPRVRGQGDTLLIDASFRDTPFIEFAGWVASEKGVEIFFKEEWVRPVTITDTTGQHSLGAILRKAFPDQGLYYFADRAGNIIITRDDPIHPPSADLFRTDEDPGAEVVSEDLGAGPEDTVEPQESQGGRVIVINGNGHGSGGDRTSSITLSGRIREMESGEAVIGAVVYVEDKETGVITDENGYYILTLPRGTHFLVIRSMGKKEVRYQVEALSSGILDVLMEDQVSRLKGVEIVAENTRNVTRLQLGLDKVDMKTVLELPAAMGETDIIKAALLLPGVQTVGEGASGFNVRGGSTGQNLFLLNAAPVFNSSHLFGFFSAFNPDVINSFSLYKSGIPARYGGRLSSVFDMDMKTGNKKKFAASGGISPITGRLLIEGPVIKNKTSFIAGGRTTYSDWILNRVNDPSIRNSDARFHDLNFRVSHEFNASNKLDVAAYYSYDHFRLNNDTSYQYSNLNGSIIYTHHFSEKLLSTYSAIVSNYNHMISTDKDPGLAFDLTNDIRYREAKADFAWYPAPEHKVKFGLSTIFYGLNPGTRRGAGEESIIADQALEDEQGVETSLYISDEYKVSSRLLLYGGLRFSSFFYLGPRTIHTYREEMPLEPHYVTGEEQYNKGSLIQSYMGPEFRVSMRYIIDRYSSVKFSYNRMRQYLHMISNTTAISPTDSWKLSDPFLKPQVGDQLAAGYYLELLGNRIETSTEIYYKKLSNIVEYKGGATLMMNEMLETDLINGTGQAYGLELMIKKRGRLNGWLSYTYSRIFHLVNGTYPSEQINSGKPYPANHDKPHDFTVTGNFKFSRRFAVSSNFTYSTGRPITFPVARYEQRNNILFQYSNRNEFRIPDYVRWDLSATLFGNLKSKKLAHSDWTLSVYNVTGRDNVYSIFFISQGGKTSGYKLSVFNQPIVTLTYNFRL